MSKIVSIHSFRGGTGKSNISATLATVLASEGQRVGVIDTDIQSPGIHILFGLEGHDITRSLNDYLNGACSILDTAHPVLQEQVAGKLFLIPSSVRANDIVQVLRQGYDIRLLTACIQELIAELHLDTLIIDTHPGLNEETLFALAISSTIAVVMRPDRQDYEGTGVTVEVARSLDAPRLMLIVNKVPPEFDFDDLKAQVERTYDCPVAAVLPHSNEMMSLGSNGVFVLHYPQHPLTVSLRKLALQLAEA